jgi:hypothetical protein
VEISFFPHPIFRFAIVLPQVVAKLGTELIFRRFWGEGSSGAAQQPGRPQLEEKS